MTTTYGGYFTLTHQTVLRTPDALSDEQYRLLSTFPDDAEATLDRVVAEYASGYTQEFLNSMDRPLRLGEIYWFACSVQNEYERLRDAPLPRGQRGRPDPCPPPIRYRFFYRAQVADRVVAKVPDIGVATYNPQPVPAQPATKPPTLLQRLRKVLGR